MDKVVDWLPFAVVGAALRVVGSMKLSPRRSARAVNPAG